MIFKIVLIDEYNLELGNKYELYNSVKEKYYSRV